MKDHLETRAVRNNIVAGGYSDIIVKETGGLTTFNIQFDDAYKTRAAYQNAMPGKDSAYVSILIIGYNKLQEHTKYCIESILKYTTDIDYELVLLDNGSSDGTFEYYQSVPHAKKRIIRVTQNKGGNYGVYLATNHLMGRYVAMIANDVYVTKNWLSNMLKCAESDERIGFLAPASDNVSNLQAVNLPFKSLEEMQIKAGQYNISDPRKWEERLRLMPAIALYKRECLDIVGSLDYAFQHDFSDDDISIRVRRAGYKLVFCGDVFVHHVGPTVTGTSSGDKIGLLKTGREIFKQKYFGIDAWEDVNNFEMLMLHLVNPEDKRGTSQPEVLGIDVMCGTPILQLKNKLRHTDIFDTKLSAFSQDAKYWLDLKTVCAGDVIVDRITHLTEYFSKNKFDYILLGRPINSYQEMEKILADILSLLKSDGQLLIKIRNNFDMQTFLHSMKKGLGTGNKTISNADINNLNMLMMKHGYAIHGVRKSLYNIDDAAKEIIRQTLKKSGVAQNIDSMLTELIAEEYALKIMRNVAHRNEPAVDQQAFVHSTSPNVKITATNEPLVQPDIVAPIEKPLQPNFKQKNFTHGMTSIIILTQNRLEQTKKCFTSILKHTPEFHEIIFVDNDSTDGTAKWLQTQIQENKNYCLIENKENLGLARGRNQGINMSQGEFILLVDNDVIVSEGWLAGMMECLHRAPAAGIVGPMTNSSKGIQRVMEESYRSVDYLDTYAAKFKEQYRHRQILCRNIAGFCMLLKRTLTDKIGLFDQRFGTGRLEDEDFCIRAALDGYKNYIAGDVFIHHQGGKGSPGDRDIIEQKWTLSTASSEGRKLAVLKNTELANDLYSRGKTDQAAKVLINSIKLTTDANEIYYELARIFIESKRYSESWEVINSMPEEAKNELKTLECAGYVKEGLGLDDDAAACADKMLSQRENHPAALNLKGILAFKKSENDKSADYFRKAIKADPGYGEAYTNLGVIYWGMDKKDEALQYLRKGFVLSPTVPDVSSLYYSVVSSLGIYSEAETEFREVCMLYPHNKNLTFLYIDTIIQQGKFDFAMPKIEDALALFGFDEGTLKAALAIREKIGPLRIQKASNKNTLSLCMIVKNEEKFLAKSLKSIRGVVDEMIVVDTGSTDRTKDIANVLGARVFDFPWTGDFSEARNYSLDQAQGDWILILDADEVISPGDHKLLLKTINQKNSKPVAYNLVTRNYLNKTGTAGWIENVGSYPDEEAGIGWNPSGKVRLFRRSRGIRFENPVHELLEASLRKAKIPIEKSTIPIHHYGRLDHNKVIAKGREYYELGRKKLEERGGDYVALREMALQTGELGMYNEAIDLWQQTLALRPDDVEALFNLAYHLMRIGKYQEALTAAKKAVELSPGTKDAVLNYALCEMLTGNVQKTTALLEESLSDDNENPTMMAVLGASYLISGNNDSGQAVFKKIAKKKVNSIAYINDLLEKLITSGQIKYLQLLINAVISGNIADRRTLLVQMTPILNKITKQLHAQGKKDDALLILNTTIKNDISNQETMILVDVLHKGISGL